jgi:hypothetical protein
MGSINAGTAGTPDSVSVLPVSITTVRGIDGCAMAKDRG